MPEALYGKRMIKYSIEEKSGLKSHYISVDKMSGVVLKGKSISDLKAEKMILKKARWIIDKLALVQSIEVSDIVTGSRIPYLGKKYYVELFINEAIDSPMVEFNHSKFKIAVPSQELDQIAIREQLDLFYEEKAKEKIIPRLKKLSRSTGLKFNELKFRWLEKRWGSCTTSNNLVINYEAIKLSHQLIDYLLIHELVHTIVKDHSKQFWAELSKHLSNYKELDELMYGMSV
jgi:predicted metal-dependent hydrolase